MEILGQKERFEFFVAYLAHKIQKGIKQNVIADYVGKSPSYINKLYKGEVKSCPDEVQIKTAEFFNISINKLLEEGRSILYENEKNYKPLLPFEEKRSLDPFNLLNQLEFVKKGIEKLTREKEGLQDKIYLYDLILKEIQEGLTFFNDKREFVFSTNRWNLLDGVDITSNPSIESIMLTTRKKIKNFDEVSEALFGAFNQRKEMSVRVKLINGMVFIFHAKPLYAANDKFLGILLINVPEIKK